MTRLQKTILWAVAVCVFGFAAARVLIIPASVAAVAQEPKPGDRAGSDAPSTDEYRRFLEDRKPEPPSPAKVMEPAVDGATVAYPFDTPDAASDARRLSEQYAGLANINLEIRPKNLGVPYLHVRAPADVQAEIRAVVGFLMKQRPEPTAVSAFDKGGPPIPASGDGYRLTQQQQQANLDRLRELQEYLKLADAKSDQERAAARTQLRKLLAEVFDQDMQMREKRAAEIEARLAKLRQQYQAREKVKDEIIDLQLKVIEQDAAGLGFPGGQPSVSPPASGSGLGGIGASFGNRTNLPASATATPRDPMTVRRGGSSARTVDQSDPIPRERTLDEVKKADPAVVATMKKRGHFIESADGKLFAYANVNWPDGPSVIRVVDSATGKLLGTAMVNSVVRALEFTDEGVASRERDDKLELRIPLRRRTGPDGNAYEPAAANPNPLDPMTAALDPEFLKKYSAEPQQRVGELSARGHFVGSPDGKHYAYVETKGDNIPEGTAEIRVCDARTGQRWAAAKIKLPVGKLKFLNEGVAMEDGDGTLKLRIPLSTEHGLLDVLESKRVPSAGKEHAPRPMPSSLLSPESHSSFTSDYNALRNQYRQARAALAVAEAHFNESVADAQKARPETTVDDVKKQLPNAVRAIERAQSNFEAAKRLLETKLNLLELDLKTANLARNAAETIECKLTGLL